MNPPKTASGSREAIFIKYSDINIETDSLSKNPLGIRHFNYKMMVDFCRNNNINHREYFIFTFVRNPWDRMVSCWKNRAKAYKDFNNFVNDYPYNENNHNGMQNYRSINIIKSSIAWIAILFPLLINLNSS